MLTIVILLCLILLAVSAFPIHPVTSRWLRGLVIALCVLSLCYVAVRLLNGYN